MDIEKKKDLLSLAEALSVDINKANGGNFTPKIINAIKIVQKYDDISMFKKVLNSFKKTSFGGNKEKIAYSNFVDNTLKKEEYKQINELNLSELEYVFSWVRRLVKEKSAYSKR